MTQEKVEAVNKLLLDGEPGNISVDDHSDYIGYKPQSVVDAMNKVFWGQWGFEELSSEIVTGTNSSLAVAHVQVSLKGNDFKPTSYGQNRVTRGDIGDARKGAQTDAIKKALSYFSIGNRAYHGLLEKPGQATNTRTIPARPSPALLEVSTVQPTPRPTAASMDIANAPINSGQLRGIEDLLVNKLHRPFAQEEYQGLTSMQAAGLIQQLTSEWNVARQQQTANRERVAAK